MPNWGMSLIGLDALDATIDGLSESLVNAEWKCGTRVEYAVEVEFGNSGMQANRGMRNAVEQVKRESDAIADQVSSTDELCKQMAFRIEEIWKANLRGEGGGPRRIDTWNLHDSIRAEPVG